MGSNPRCPGRETNSATVSGICLGNICACACPLHVCAFRFVCAIMYARVCMYVFMYALFTRLYGIHAVILYNIFRHTFRHTYIHVCINRRHHWPTVKHDVPSDITDMYIHLDCGYK